MYQELNGKEQGKYTTIVEDVRLLLKNMKINKKMFEITSGIILVILGAIGGLIPIFPGVVFGIPGILLLAKHFKFVRDRVEWVKNKFKIAKKCDEYCSFFRRGICETKSKDRRCDKNEQVVKQ